VSTLGIGFEAATAVTQRSNVRGGFNFLNYNRSLNRDGIRYEGELKLRSVHLTYDQYIVSGLHVSPGLLVHNGNRAVGNASVLPGQSFFIGDGRYFSGQTNPIHGSATIKVRKVSPMVLLGFGNLLPRSSRHFGINFDFGVVFQGSPDAKLNLAGTACAISPITACLDAATEPTVQSNIRREQDQANDDLQPFKYYPVISLGFSWKF
jgi:hypothetical protein